NPFNPETRINYAVPKPARVTIEIFNTLGQKVRTLVDVDKPAGSYEVIWDGRNDHGQTVVSGIYFYQLRTAEAKLTRRMLLMR
ncbi:MAG: FlgD immunoglobulin-like domain containing protein, partial [bacterium]